MRSKFIVRFVDIVLILLFGFIAISRIQDKSQIDLPESSNTPKSEAESAILIFVGVTESGVYLVEGETRTINSVPVLRRYLSDKSAGLDLSRVRVRLRSQWNAPIRHAIAAARVCDELGLDKSIDVEVKRGA